MLTCMQETLKANSFIFAARRIYTTDEWTDIGLEFDADQVYIHMLCGASEAPFLGLQTFWENELTSHPSAMDDKDN